jgi:hypothetical protein
MENDLLTCDCDETLLPETGADAQISSWVLSHSVHVSIDQFSSAVKTVLAPYQIDVRFDELADGSRFATARRFDVGGAWQIIPVDSLKLCPSEVDRVASSIRTMVDYSMTD